jgi:hypothetical protein
MRFVDFHLKKPNKHHKNLSKPASNPKSPKKYKVIESKKLKQNLVYFFKYVYRKAHYHQTPLA